MGASVPFFFKWIGILNETKSISASKFWKFKTQKAVSDQNFMHMGKWNRNVKWTTSHFLKDGGGIFKH